MRRIPVLLLALWMWGAGSISHSAAQEAERSRPNILFAFADDWGRFAGIYAAVDSDPGMNAVVSTPNFDAIARRGVLFKNAFVNAPSCTPCRSSLLSGQYFWRTGRAAILQGAVWDSEIPAWPLLLKESGYHIGKTWKVWSPGVPADAPYGANKHTYQSAGNRFNQFSQQASRLVAQGKSIDEAKETLLSEARANFTSFLDARSEGQPFCYWFGPTNVHRKWVRGSGKKFWGIDPDELKGKLPPFLPDVPTVREDLADYFGEVAAFDAGLGQLVEELKTRGEYDNTLIVVSGDHGPPGFPHGKCNLYDFGVRVSLAIAGPGVSGGRVVEDFTSLPDLAPTFLHVARVSPPKVMTARSLWPVLGSERVGLVDPNRNWVLTGRERHVAMAREGLLPYPQRAIRTKDHLLVVNFQPERYPLGDPYRLAGGDPPTTTQLTENTFVTLPDEDAGPTKAWLVDHREDPEWKPFFEHAYGKRPRLELFDLEVDPHQMTNVAGKAEYVEVRDRLFDLLINQLSRSDDPRMKDDGSFFENPPLAGPIPDDAQRKKPRKKPRR